MTLRALVLPSKMEVYMQKDARITGFRPRKG